MENPIKMDDLEVPLFSETSMLKGNESSSNHQFSADMFGFQCGLCCMLKTPKNREANKQNHDLKSVF